MTQEELAEAPISDRSAELPESHQHEQRRFERDVRGIVAWSNAFLKQRGFEAHNLETDFRDGVRLLNLLEVAFRTRLGSYNARPKLSYHRLDNLALAFQFMKEQAVPLLSIDLHDIAGGRLKTTLNLLRQILRTLTLENFAQCDDEESEAAAQVSSNGATSKGAKVKSMRQHLMQFTEEALVDIPHVAVENFWTSFKDGIAFAGIIEKLCPGTVDVTSLDPEAGPANLQMAFAMAEEQLGIPALLTPEEFEHDREPDETAVECYLSMLVSAAAGTKKNEAAMQEKLEAMKVKKERELMDLENQMLVEKRKFQELQSNMAQLQESTEEAAEKEKAMKSQIENDAVQLESYKTKFAMLTKNVEASHSMLQASLQNEGDLRARIKELESMVAERDASLEEQQEMISKLNSEIYSMHNEIMDTMHKFKEEENTRAGNDRSDSGANQGVQDNLSALFKQSILEQKSYSDFMSSLTSKKGWLMKRKLGGGFFSKPKLKKCYFELHGDVLYYSSKKGVVLSQSRQLKLRFYQKIQFDFTDKTTDEDFISRNENQVDVRDSSFVIRLLPKPNVKGMKSIELLPVQSYAAEFQEDIWLWVEEINNRIALSDYLIDMENGRMNCCRELVEFIANRTQSVVSVTDRVQDLHRALLHFKEGLIMRKNLSIIFDNVALSNPCVDVLAEILSRNNTIRRMALPRNLITSRGIKALSEALKQNRSLEELSLIDNQIKDEGLKMLTDVLPVHPRLRILHLSGNGVGDEGVKALGAALAESSEKYNWTHEFPCLDLSRNFITDEGAKALAAIIRDNETVTKIRLNNNLITDAGIESLCAALSERQRPLKEFLLAKNQLSSKGVIALSSALGNISTPLIVDLSRNQLIGRRGIRALLDADVPIKFEGFRIIRGSEVPSDRNSVSISELIRSRASSRRTLELDTVSEPPNQAQD